MNKIFIKILPNNELEVYHKYKKRVFSIKGSKSKESILIYAAQNTSKALNKFGEKCLTLDGNIDIDFMSKQKEYDQDKDKSINFQIIYVSEEKS